MEYNGADTPAVVQQLANLLDLSRRAHLAASASELEFLLVNDSHALAPYRQAALWLAHSGVRTLSGLVQVEANAPYALWLGQVCRQLSSQRAESIHTFEASDLPAELVQHWQEWWPPHALWLSWPDKSQTSDAAAGLVLVREVPWTAQEQALLREWADIWWHAHCALHPSHAPAWYRIKNRLTHGNPTAPDARRWWQRPALRWTVLVGVVLAFPVHLTVLAPGELVPAHPVVIRAPLEGVVDVFHVQPNQTVTKGQPLFGFDEALIQSRLDVAAQTLSTAETDYRQTSQQALMDAKFRPQLALLTGKIEEKRAEVDFFREQLTRARVLAPQDGVALFDDPTEWIGKPVAVGERIMRIAAPQDSEVEAWLPIADAIALPNEAPVNLYLNASPLFAVTAKLRYMAHEAVQRPDGSYAYRVRATLDAPTAHRVGLKGTAKLQGPWVPLAYWVLRRPLAGARTALGL